MLMIFIGYFELFYDQTTIDKTLQWPVTHLNWPQCDHLSKLSNTLGNFSKMMLTGVQTRAMDKEFAAVSVINNQHCKPLLSTGICGWQN